MENPERSRPLGVLFVRIVWPTRAIPGNASLIVFSSAKVSVHRIDAASRNAGNIAIGR